MKQIPDPPKTLEECRPRFIVLIGELIEMLELRKNLDIRDRVATLALIERVLYREKPDVDAERAGSKVKQYAPNFAKAANGGGGRGTDPGPADPAGAAEGDPEPADDGDEHPDAG